MQRTPLFERALDRGVIPRAEGRTVFNVIGGWLPLTIFLVLAGFYLVPRRSGQRPVPPLDEDPRVAVILPTYNERETIEEVIGRILVADERIDVKVVDDSSPDGTGDIVRKVAERESRVSICW